MSLRDSKARLRLAARTLIEWRVPPVTKQYQTVVSALLDLHPDAVAWGLTAGSRIFELDDHGAILRHLSETLENDSSQQQDTSGGVEDLTARVLAVCHANLNYYVQIESNDEGIWPGGFYGDEFATVLLEALKSSDRARTILGCQALLGMLLYDDKQLRRSLMSQLMTHAARVRQWSFRVTYSIEMSRLYAHLVPLAWSTGIIGYMSFLMYAARAQSAVGRASLWLGLVCFGTLVVALLFQSLRPLVSWWFGLVQSKDLQKLKSDPPRFFAITNEVCSRNPALLLALIKTRSPYPIAEYVLQATREVNPEGARVMLALFSSADVAPYLLTDIFRWLCGVQIRDDLETLSRK